MDQDQALTNRVLSSAIQMDWTPAHFDLTKEPSLQSTITVNVDPGFSGNFPRVAKWYEQNVADRIVIHCYKVP